MRTELAVRIAHRLRDMQALPYVVVTQEGVAKVYEVRLYAHSKAEYCALNMSPAILDCIRQVRCRPRAVRMCITRAAGFADFLKSLTCKRTTHSVSLFVVFSTTSKHHFSVADATMTERELHSKSVIPNLSLGLSLSSPYLLPDRLDTFMRKMLVSRISRRVLAEHHIALTQFVKSRHGGVEAHENVGIIYTGLRVQDSIERCATYLRRRAPNTEEDTLSGPLSDADWSEVIVDGHKDTRFAYIREHLE